MDELIVPVPRQLRVQSAIVLPLAGTRVSARAFLSVAALLVVGALMLVVGAELVGTLQRIGALAVLSVLALEGRLWGRAPHTVARLLLRHLGRAPRLRLTPLLLVLPPADLATPAALPRPRWLEERTTP